MPIKNVSEAAQILNKLNLKQDLSEYGKSFQLKLLSLIIQDRVFAHKILPILKIDYFSDAMMKRIYGTVILYINTYNLQPSFDNIKILLQEKIEKSEDLKKYEKMLKEIEKINLDDRQFIIDNAHSFCFSRHASNELERALEYVRRNEFEKASSTVYSAFSHTMNNTTRIMSLKEDYNIVFDEEANNKPMPTIFPTFNDNMQGGPGAGKLVIGVAASNFGKTNALVATARHLNSIGKNVVLFTFEIGSSEIFRRHLAGLTDTTQSEVKYNKKQVELSIKTEGFGDFYLVEERATKATTGVIKENLNYLKSKGFYPDVILVDSLNQLKLPQGIYSNSDNNKFEYLAEELRDFAKEEDCCVYTVFQGNRSAFKAEVNDEQNIGKAIEPFQVADVLMFFSQTPEMAERGICIVNLLKNRLGRKFILLECAYDPDKCVFKEIREIDRKTLLTQDQIKEVTRSAEKVLGNLKQKYGHNRSTTQVESETNKTEQKSSGGFEMLSLNNKPSVEPKAEVIEEDNIKRKQELLNRLQSLKKARSNNEETQ